MNLTQGEKIQIRQLLQSPQWKTAELVANQISDEIAYNPKTRDNEWETLKSVLIEEGKIQGIKQFIQELYKLAQSNE